jgi:hypothetical protein
LNEENGFCLATYFQIGFYLTYIVRFLLMRFIKTLLIASIVAAHPALAETEGSPALAQNDEAAIDKLIDPTLSQLRAGHALPALNAFFGTSRLMAGKTVELQALASQINSTMEIYGALGQCELVERRNRGSFVQVRLYVCQHDSMATRWRFIMVKTTGGWIGANVYFDDKAFKAISE